MYPARAEKEGNGGSIERGRAGVFKSHLAGVGENQRIKKEKGTFAWSHTHHDTFLLFIIDHVPNCYLMGAAIVLEFVLLAF